MPGLLGVNVEMRRAPLPALRLARQIAIRYGLTRSDGDTTLPHAGKQDHIRSGAGGVRDVAEV